MGPQSLPGGFNSSRRLSRRCPDLTTGPAASAVRRTHFPRVERRDRFSGRHEPRRRVALALWAGVV